MPYTRFPLLLTSRYIARGHHLFYHASRIELANSDFRLVPSRLKRYHVAFLFSHGRRRKMPLAQLATMLLRSSLVKTGLSVGTNSLISSKCEIIESINCVLSDVGRPAHVSIAFRVCFMIISSRDVERILTCCFAISIAF